MRGSSLRALALAFRFALRDLIGDPRGFGVFIACIIIGVAAIAGVNGLSRALTQGLAHEGRMILGGDLSFNLSLRGLDANERGFLEQRGRIDEIVMMRAMARRGDGESALVEIKAVDPSTYPPAGALDLAPALAPPEALAIKDGVAGLLPDPTLMARLDLKIGDRVTIGAKPFEIRALLRGEPDKLAGGIGFGARAIMSRDALAATGLMQQGAIIRYFARLALPAGAGDADVARVIGEARAVFPKAGWDIRTRDAVSPQFSRNIDRFTQLLTLVALTALVAGGAGVANAVQGLIDRKRAAFAILKALGAPASRVFLIALIEVVLAAALAIGLGLTLGALLPLAAGETLRRITELPVTATLDPGGLGLGALYGLLVTLVFALPPLGRAHEISVATLLRDDAAVADARLKPRYLALWIGALLALAATVALSASDKKLALIYVCAAGAAFLLLRGVAALTMRAARRLPHARDARLRLALANIHRPHSLTPALVVSIGLTQTLLIALALVEGAIHTELARSDTGKIPSFYFIDVPKAEAQGFASFLDAQASGGRIDHVPMLRGRIVAVKGARVETLRVADDVSWALEGDRGVTFAATPPKGSELVAGDWWPAEYDGPPLVSLEAKVAGGLGLGLGDEITVNVMGREITARVASLRRVDWRSYAINFVMVFSPNVFAKAPYTEMFTITAADGATPDDKITRAVAKKFPAVAAIRVKDALEAVDKIAGQLAVAARAAAGLAVITALLALSSAVAAGQRARLHDAVILKTLGATRGWLAAAYALEFGILGAVASVFALFAGSAAAYAMLVELMKLDFVFAPVTVALLSTGALAVTIALGLAGTWRTLARRPGPELRDL